MPLLVVSQEKPMIQVSKFKQLDKNNVKLDFLSSSHKRNVVGKILSQGTTTSSIGTSKMDNITEYQKSQFAFLKKRPIRPLEQVLIEDILLKNSNSFSNDLEEFLELSDDDIEVNEFKTQGRSFIEGHNVSEQHR